MVARWLVTRLHGGKLTVISSIISRCLGNDPALLPQKSILGKEQRPTRESGGNQAYYNAGSDQT